MNKKRILSKFQNLNFHMNCKKVQRLSFKVLYLILSVSISFLFTCSNILAIDLLKLKPLGDMATPGNIVIFIAFADDDLRSSDEVNKNIDTIKDYLDGEKLSLKKFIYDYTGKKTRIKNYFGPCDENGKVYYYQDAKPRGYYTIKSNDNPYGYDNSDLHEIRFREQQLIKNASKYFNKHRPKELKNGDDIDSNNDNLIDNVNFIIYGETIDAANNILYPHTWCFNDDSMKIFDKTFYIYNMTTSGESLKGFGTMAHEFLHSFGYPDLYRKDGSGRSVGHLDLMASGSYTYLKNLNIPTVTLAYSKYTYGKIGAAPLEINNSGEYELDCMADDEDGTKTVFAKIKCPYSDREFIYVEYRRINFSEDLPNSFNEFYNWDRGKCDNREGLIVYRVNTSIQPYYGNLNASYNSSTKTYKPDHVYVYKANQPNINEGAGMYNEFWISPNMNNDNNIINSIGSAHIDSNVDVNDLYLSDGRNSRIKISVDQSACSNNKKIKFKVAINYYDNDWYKNIEDNYYRSNKDILISTSEQFMEFARLANTGKNFKGKTIKLTQDIDISKYKWHSIGSEANKFQGIFDGRNHSIKGLNLLDRTNQAKGLFSYNEGTIKNIRIIDGDIQTKEYGSVGGIAGKNQGNIENCYYNGSIRGIGFVGAIVGYNYCNISNCYNTGQVSGTEMIGGIAGYSSSNISNCYNTGQISGAEMIGGIAGHSSLNISNCYNIGKVSGTGMIGGIAGYNFANISNCSNIGIVQGSSNYGGIIGQYSGGSWNRLENNCFLGCDVGIGGNSVAKTGTSLFFNINKSSIEIGNTEQIKNYFTQELQALVGVNKFSCQYESSNEDIITVSSSGKITAINLGNANITIRLSMAQSKLTPSGWDGDLENINYTLQIPIKVKK